MSMPGFSEFPPIPRRSAPEADFDAKMYAVFQHFATTHRDEMIALLAWLSGEGIGEVKTPEITDFNAVTEGATRSIVDYSAVLNGPPQFSSGPGVMRHHASINAFNAAQVAFFLNDERVAMRRMRNGTWRSWRVIYTGASILGAVSKADGVPSGALIDSGSNGNGEYIAWADGTLICTKGNSAITTAPATFVGTITKIDGDKLWIGRWI